MANHEKAHNLLHVLWTKAVGNTDYDKKQWQELETAISNLSKPDFDDMDTPPVEPFPASSYSEHDQRLFKAMKKLIEEVKKAP